MLALSNFKLRQARQEAANYFRACAAMKSPFQAMADDQSGAPENTIHWNQVNLLIPNLGSTSLKYQILEMPSETVLAKGRAGARDELPGGDSRRSRPATAAIDAVALKAVHAGRRYRGTFVVDDGVVGGAAAVPAGGAGAQCDLPDGDRGLPGGDAGSADCGGVRAGVPRHHAGARAALRRAGRSGWRTAWRSTGSTARRTSTSPSAWRRCWGGR